MCVKLYSEVTPELEQLILSELKELNLSQETLGLKYNVSRYKLGQIRKKYGIKNRDCKHHTEQSILFKDGLRKCSSCKEILSLENFTKKKDSRPIRGIYSYCCRKCSAKKSLISYRKHYLNIDSILELRLKASKKRTKVENTLTFENLKECFLRQEGKCFYTGINLTFTPKDLSSISLDRKDSSIGYHKDNVVLCCHIVNLMKQSLSVNEFIRWCGLVVNHNLLK